MNLSNQLKHNLLSIRGSKTHRKIVVIESDDWGSIRIPNRKALKSIENKHLVSGNNLFNKLDSLESKSDLIALYELFDKFKDKNGNSPILTANFLTANPNFDKIKESNFQNYVAENIIESYSRYNNNEDTFGTLKVGINHNFIRPQYHGREHLNRSSWMKMLQVEGSVSRKSFDDYVFCLDEPSKSNKRDNLMAAFDFSNEAEKNNTNLIFEEGYLEFEKLFGYKSKSFISPCYVWDKSLEKKGSEMGIKLIQGIYNQYIPQMDNNPYKLKLHFNGQRNEFGQNYVVRNCFMEVFESLKNPIDDCLKRMEIAFRWGKPAVIGMHRVNFVGNLDENNRTRTLKSLDDLFQRILKKWPDVEFMSTDQLENII